MHSEIHRTRRHQNTAALALLIALGAAVPANAESPGVRMRRARQALSVADDTGARQELEAVQAASPRSPRGLEAAMLLADLDFRAGRREAAAARLSAASEAADGSFGSALIGVTRGWLAIGMGDSATAHERFREVGRNLPGAGQVVAFGQAWADLLQGRADQPDPSLVEWIKDGPHPGFQFAAGLTVARMHQARGEWRRARRRLRETRQALRGSRYEDDAELALGLLQLDTGSPRVARATFRRLERRFATRPRRSLAPLLSLHDLRQAPAAFAARLAGLFAAREKTTTPLFQFLGDAFDRQAAEDANSAILLAEAALRARGEHDNA